jgi:hypothetical protein
LVCF